MPRFACECKVEFELEEHFVVEEEHEAAAAMEAKDEFQELIVDVIDEEIECKCKAEEGVELL